MEALKKAEAELSFKKTEYDKQRILVNELKESLLLPEQIKNYEGKYFREQNSYGCGSDTKPWFIYYFIKKVTSTGFCEAVTIQLEAYGTLEIQNDRHLPLSMCTKEISKKAFLSAIKGFEKHIADTLQSCR